VKVSPPIVTLPPSRVTIISGNPGLSERVPEAIRETECEDGERLVESFADARRRTWIAILKASRHILEQASRRRDLRLLVGAGDDRADPGTLPLRQMLEDVSEFVDAAAVHQRRRPKGLRHRFVQRFGAIEDDQEAAISPQAAALQIDVDRATDSKAPARRLDRPRASAKATCCRRTRALPFSGDFLEHVDLEVPVSHRLFQAAVLVLELA
jgi:hypothetical protein